RRVRRHSIRWHRERDGARTQHAIEALVPQQYRVIADLRRQHATSLVSSKPAYLENVGEIGAEREPQRSGDFFRTVVGQRDPLVQASVPKKAGALAVDDTLGRHLAAELGQRTVRQTNA